MLTKTDEFIQIGHAAVMELIFNPKKELHLVGRGNILLKDTTAIYLQKDAENSRSLFPELLLLLEKDVLIKKVKERLYDITCSSPSKKIIELIFDNEVSDESLHTFDDMVVSLGSNKQQLEVDPGESSRVAEIIEKGGVIIASGIDLASYWTSVGIVKGGKILKNNIKPLEEPTVVNEKWEKRLSVAKSASSSVKGATKTVAKVAEDTLTYAINKTSGDSFITTKPVVKSTARASIRILDSLDDAADHILSTASDTASDFIEYRYGNEAAEAAKKGGSTVKSSYKAHKNIRKIGRKSVMKAVGNVSAEKNNITLNKKGL